MQGIGEGEKKIIRDFLVKRFRADLIMLFGSAVRGQMRWDSDIDIAFLSELKFSPYEVFMAAQELAGALKREIHLIDLNQVSTVLQAQVVGTGQVIYCASEERRMRFAMLALKKYARLNEERKHILDQVKERGSVYG